MMNLYYDDILDYGLESLDSDVQEEQTYDSFWEGSPFQGYKIFYATGTGAIFFSMFFMLPSLWSIAYFLSMFFKPYNPYESMPLDVISSIFFLLLLPFIFIDTKEYIFRKGNKYWVTRKGIIFRRGYFKKNDYLLPWDNIEYMEISKSRNSIYFETKLASNIKLASPNERKKKIYVETDDAVDFLELLKILKRFIKVEYQAI